MKRPLIIAAAALTISALAGCEMLLVRNNLFASLEPDPTDKYADLSGSDVMTELERDSDSPTFYANLTEDTATRDAITAKLDEIIANSTDNTVKQDAALMKTEVVLNTTPSGEVVNSLVAGLVSQMSGGDGGGASDPGELIAAVIGPVEGVIADEASFTELIESMTGLADDYATIAATLGDPNAPQTLSPEIAQAAVIALVVDSLVDNIDFAETGVAAGETFASSTEALFAMVTAATDDDAATNVPLTMKPGSENLFDTLLGVDSDMMTILDAAGLGSFFDGLFGSDSAN